MQRVAQHDQGALSELYQCYGRLVNRSTMRILPDMGLEEEATQDTFLKLWNRPEAWDSNKGQLSTWLYTVARYAAIDRIRKDGRVRNDQGLDSIFDLSSPGNPLTDPMLQDGQLLRALFSKLPPEQLQLIELAFYHGMTHSGLAQELNLPLGTVKTRLRSGLRRLKGLWEAANRLPG